MALALGGYFSQRLQCFHRFPGQYANLVLDTLCGRAGFFHRRRVILPPCASATAELESEVAELQAQVIQLQQQVGETEILAALVDFARANPENSYQGAAVIGRDPSPFLHYVIINRRIE